MGKVTVRARKRERERKTEREYVGETVGKGQNGKRETFYSSSVSILVSVREHGGC